MRWGISAMFEIPANCSKLPVTVLITFYTVIFFLGTEISHLKLFHVN